ncbi:hypothetical protein QR90_08535 [Deinococcus radiopugnans]|uniref:OmpA-like domain-containing protein n=1 Tax=Deinococcus radiopugnans TaxID=57497 RepID=A0A0A7KIS4_9DEIO|nr:OmpA family protein [Deinococcus radiopugnans]AIZ45139.1 hypothetical protein QR90_08535 [Deinococcus radiopugnans]
MIRRRTPDVEQNFYIAYADMAFTMVLVMTLIAVLVVLYGRIGWDDIQYKQAQAQIQREVISAYARTKLRAPYVNKGRNDPPGAQRWVFNQKNLFLPGTAQLTQESRRTLLAFAGVVREHDQQWRRLRIEGHTKPPRRGEPDNWQLSAARAEMVTRIFSGAGHIPAYKMAIAGRAGQNPIFKGSQSGNERVEILIEYTNPKK